MAQYPQLSKPELTELLINDYGRRIYVNILDQRVSLRVVQEIYMKLLSYGPELKILDPKNHAENELNRRVNEKINTIGLLLRAAEDVNLSYQKLETLNKELEIDKLAQHRVENQMWKIMDNNEMPQINNVEFINAKYVRYSNAYGENFRNIVRKQRRKIILKAEYETFLGHFTNLQTRAHGLFFTLIF